MIDYENEGIDQYNPRHVKEILGYYKIVKISAGATHNAVITDKLELYTWGEHVSG